MVRVSVREVSFATLAIALAVSSLGAQELTLSGSLAHVDALRAQQCQVQAAVRTMPRAAGPERDAVLQELLDTKNHMYADITALETLLDSTPGTQDAADVIRASKLKEKLEFSRGTIEQWQDGSENQMEWVIQQDLGTLRNELDPAPSALECPSPV
jgi:hypothetical protein